MLYSGYPLELQSDGYFTAEVDDKSRHVGNLSKACLDRLRKFAEKGYTSSRAQVRFIVAWKGEDDKEETAVVLPEITLSKGRSIN